MLLDDFFQIALPCLLVLFGNKYNMFMIIILNYSLKSEQAINKSIIFATSRMALLPLKRI